MGSFCMRYSLCMFVMEMYMPVVSQGYIQTYNKKEKKKHVYLPC